MSEMRPWEIELSGTERDWQNAGAGLVFLIELVLIKLWRGIRILNQHLYKESESGG